jgi:poly(hydroxyalkanoate) depolymerase family esterase
MPNVRTLCCRLTLVAVLAVSSRTADAALTAVTGFGTNPGGLAMYEYVPAGLTPGRPVVVVMHGCTQTAANMEAAGWNALADQYKFSVVYPEQSTSNNPVRCFNWAGEYGDTANLVRGQGENQSLIQMIDRAITAHDADPARVFVVGFSAGAAMTAVLAATWPDRIAGVAIMSGIPYRCATTVNEAYGCQSPGVTKVASAWGDLVRASRSGPYPRIQIWHGASDTTVVPANQTELIKQWTNAHGTDDTADQTETIGTATRTAYAKAGVTVVEAYKVTGMGHATAVGTDPAGACPSVAGSYFSNKSICATLRAAMFFGIATGGGGGGGGGGGTDTSAPTLAFLTPGDGDLVSGELTIVVAASDDVAIDHVALTIDGADAGTVVDAPYQFAWDATAAGPGDHTLVAVATDASGNTAMTSIAATVPGAGGVGGGGGNGAVPGSDELPGCSLDAGGGGSGAGVGALVLAVVVGVRRRRRRQDCDRAHGPREGPRRKTVRT